MRVQLKGEATFVQDCGRRIDQTMDERGGSSAADRVHIPHHPARDICKNKKSAVEEGIAALYWRTGQIFARIKNLLFTSEERQKGEQIYEFLRAYGQ